MGLVRNFLLVCVHYIAINALYIELLREKKYFQGVRKAGV